MIRLIHFSFALFICAAITSVVGCIQPHLITIESLPATPKAKSCNCALQARQNQFKHQTNPHGAPKRDSIAARTASQNTDYQTSVTSPASDQQFAPASATAPVSAVAVNEMISSRKQPGKFAGQVVGSGLKTTETQVAADQVIYPAPEHARQNPSPENDSVQQVQYTIPVNESYPAPTEPAAASFHSTEIQQPRQKTATQRLQEVMQENDELHAQLHDSNRHLSGMEKELAHSYQSLVLANLSIAAVNEQLRKMRSVTDRQAEEIASLNQMIQENELASLRRIKQLIESVRKQNSTLNGNSEQPISVPDDRNPPQSQSTSTPLTMDRSAESQLDSRTTTPLKLQPSLNPASRSSIGDLPAPTGSYGTFPEDP